MRYSLSIDYGSRYIGIALISHGPEAANRVLYAVVLVVEPPNSPAKPLEASVKPRARNRRIRRTKKTHRRRLERLAQALRGITGVEEVVRFCRRRGYSHDPRKDGERKKSAAAKRGKPKANDKELLYAVSRDEFFTALEVLIDRVVPEQQRQYVLKVCRRHLNAKRRRTAELRPARFDNRHPTTCNWKGCKRNVPRKKNAPREQLSQTLFAWLKPVFDVSLGKDEFRRFVEERIDRLVGLVRAFAGNPDKDAKESLQQRKKAVFKAIRERVARECDDAGETNVAKKFRDGWTKRYGKQLTEIVEKGQGGRTRFCREHSRQYVDYFLAGKEIPQRTEVLITDIFGRSQQIIFDRIWRLVAARILPLAGGRIDRVIVERTAFDVLDGKLKDRVGAMQDGDVAAEMYWQGPMYGYQSRLEMLKKEFGGRCAFCGQQGTIEEAEHILHKAAFPFDSYFNIVPACRRCNAEKGPRTPLEAGMTVSRDAYAEFQEYVDSRRPPHFYHTIKKGMLNLMTRGGSLATAERQLALLANNLYAIGRTQKGPRPLARFLASKIGQETRQPCKAEWISGRHTALYRGIVLPEFSKSADKQQGGLVNHAVDAIIAGCEFPSLAALENPEWNIPGDRITRFRNDVCKRSPQLHDGLPKVEPIQRLAYFEEDLGNDYLRIDLSAFNWNRQRQSGYKVDPFGKTAEGEPLKRKPAADVLKKLLSKKKSERDSQIAAIAHGGLRALLEKHKEQAPLEFVRWLQRTTKRGLARATVGDHPSDKARYDQQREFVDAPPEEFLPAAASSGVQQERGSTQKRKRKQIPPTIGIRCIIGGGVGGKLDVARRNPAAEAPLYYMAHPPSRAIYVGYRADGNGGVDRATPLVFKVTQTYEVLQGRPGKWKPVATEDESSPLRGRVLGDPFDRKQFAHQWRQALKELFERHGIVKSFRLTQGCFIEKTDGTGFQLRTFDGQKPWMKERPFADIRRVYRSPLRAQAHQPVAGD